MAQIVIIPGEHDQLRSLPTVLLGVADVRLIESANDALWEIRQAAPDVVVSGMQLGDMTGLDIAEIVPNFGSGIRVVIWCHNPDRDITRQAESAGVFRLLAGTQTIDELRTHVVTALQATPVLPEPTPEPEPAPPPAKPEPPPARVVKPEPPPAKPAEPAPRAARRETGDVGRRELMPEIQRRSNRRQGQMVVTAESIVPLRSRISDLNQEVGAQCILLTDRAGMVLTEVGNTDGIPTMILLPLLSTAFSTAGQISQVLREKDSSALYMQEGSHYDLYCFDILQGFMLVIIFNRGVLASKIGTVWVYAKRAIRDIQEHLS